MKILHITASYKPANVYGGPIMSVAKLCEVFSEKEDIRGKNQDGEFQSEKSKVKSLELKVGGFDSAQPDNGFTKPSKDSAQSCLDSAQPDNSMRFNTVQPETGGVTVYTTLANGKQELPYKNGEIKIVDGVEVRYFKRITKDHGHFSPALLWTLWKTAKQFDVIHIHAWWNLVTMPACLIAILLGKKVILTPRGTLSNYSFEVNNSKIKALFHQFIGKRLLNKCFFHCTSQKEVKDTQQLLRPNLIFEIPNFVEMPWPKQFEPKPKHEPLNLLFLSRIEKKKGLELLFGVLSESDFPFILDIAGGGDSNYLLELEQLIAHFGLREKINWLGVVNGEAKFALMANYDYLILPSYDENFANVVIESIFCGTPVLITKNVGVSAYVIKNNLGLVAERNKVAIAEQLNQALLAKNEKTFNPLTLRETIHRDFAEHKLQEEYLTMYKKVLAY